MRFNLRSIFLVTFYLCITFAAIRIWHLCEQRQKNYQAKRATIFELRHLRQAIALYKEYVGEYPPNEDISKTVSFIQERFGKPIEEIEQTVGCEFANLDSRETLVFWLNGNHPMHGNFFEFDESRLVDSDQDGWLEYVNLKGDAFRYAHGCVFVLNRDTGKAMVVDYID